MLSYNIFDEINNHIENIVQEAQKITRYDYIQKTSLAQLRPAWTERFLKGFTPCKNKRVTAKQCAIFKRMLKHDENIYNDMYENEENTIIEIYRGKINGYAYELKCFIDWGYVTSKKIK